MFVSIWLIGYVPGCYLYWQPWLGRRAGIVMQQIYTIGHSSQSMEAFIAQLLRHDVEVVADVRSQPYSARFPHFSREPALASLKAAGIRYVFLGRELGARREEPECYVDGRAVYDRIAKLPAFAAGIERVLAGAQSYRVALMCAEADPLTCHRTILVCHELKKYPLSITHIRHDGALEDHAQAERRLVEEELGSPEQADMFVTAHGFQEILEQAYARRAGNIAYRQHER
ncbi:MAG TPA: DUF488 domain-containing protein [Steroidobacteraceae bacterium]|jgi:hypothetical protein|nr:DUF488 domain-containing protein [Steroidobacteraceae bacterium]